MSGRLSAWLPAALALLVLASAFIVPGWLLNHAIFAFARGLAVLGLVLLWRAGLVSLGGALYFGLGGYTVALLQRQAGISDALLLIAGAAAVSGFSGFLLGFLLKRYRGIFFAMMNLALSMIAYGAVVKNSALGSTDGFGIAQPPFFGFQFAEPHRAEARAFRHARGCELRGRLAGAGVLRFHAGLDGDRHPRQRNSRRVPRLFRGARDPGQVHALGGARRRGRRVPRHGTWPGGSRLHVQLDRLRRAAVRDDPGRPEQYAGALRRFVLLRAAAHVRAGDRPRAGNSSSARRWCC